MRPKMNARTGTLHLPVFQNADSCDHQDNYCSSVLPVSFICLRKEKKESFFLKHLILHLLPTAQSCLTDTPPRVPLTIVATLLIPVVVDQTSSPPGTDALHFTCSTTG